MAKALSTGKTTDLAPASGQQMVTRRSFIKEGDVTGTENIGVNDIRLPRLSIAQQMSPQMIRSDGAYIQGLELGDLFNDLTGTIYGQGPIPFVVLRRDVRGIEFKPRSEGGGVVDLNVPLNTGDPRWLWTKGENGAKDAPPRATRFEEFVIILGDVNAMEMVVLSIKHTNKFNRKAAQRLTGFIKFLGKSIYAGVYAVKTHIEKNNDGTFGVYDVDQLGALDNPDVTDEQWARNEAFYHKAETMAAQLEGKNIVTEREPGDEDEFPGADADAPKM